MAASTASTRRTASREARRRQLIDATIACIARDGLSGTSIANVAREAGLSQGIVNLHFASKDNLLTETLRFVSDEYLGQFDAVLASSGPSAAAKLHALMQLDFRPSLCSRDKIGVWFAFFGEVKSRPTYHAICEKQDDYYDDVVRGLCATIIDEGGYEGVTPDGVVTILSATTNGLWLSHLINPKAFDRHEALQAIDEYLASTFPKHFPLESM